MVKIIFGTNKKVRLSKSEFDDLAQMFGQEIVAEYIEKLDENITKYNRFYLSHFDTLKERLAKETKQPIENGSSILEMLRAKYHKIKCGCGERMEFVKFDEIESGKVPNAYYKCKCGKTAYEQINENERTITYGKDTK